MPKVTNEAYKRKRDFTVLGVVGLCATTKAEFVREVFSLPTAPVSAVINLIGIPAAVMAKENSEIAAMYNNATIAAIDGMPFVKMARRKGMICERCTGTDIMGPIFEASIKQGKTHFFYGGKNDAVLQKLSGNLKRDYPGIQIVGMYSPPFRPLTAGEEQEICEQINALKPDFLWVGIGAPKQELWMQAHREKIKGTVMLGVGAAFDFYAGTLDKAPEWIENASLEWLYRLIKEPARLWRRYILGGFKYLLYSIQSKLAGE